MDRRSFLKAAAAAPLLGGCAAGRQGRGPRVAYATRPVPCGGWHDPTLGKYAGHRLTPGDAHESGFTAEGRYFERVLPKGEVCPVGFCRYVSFPVENVLVVRFEKGYCRYVNFNGSRDLAARVDRLEATELFANRVTSPWSGDGHDPRGALLADGFDFHDPVSIVWELTGEGERVTNFHKRAEFKLVEVGYGRTPERPLNIDPSLLIPPEQP